MTKVLVQFIQDRSGSMSTVWEETLSGFKNFIKDLKKKGKEDNIEYLFTLTTFDTRIEMPVKELPIDQVSENELAKHEPRAATALYDAVGKTLEATKTEADKYICVIVTDGEENSSREWSKEAVHSAIDAKINLGNWTFTYLGTQPETWSDASSLGIGVGATSTYQAQNSGATYSVLSSIIHNLCRSADLSCANIMSSEYIDEQAKTSAGMGSYSKTKTKLGSAAKTKNRNWR